ncbi:helix-turn-helix domain-containing protein [Variovorax sp. PCZ-1]|uniref:IclR family transcriptional regulator n=1 Tax=Variovorax sp. PCZ-1 TaxID=2835533 RepID=UPI001BCE1D34|nr:helix-turn-helix domain-containing protein [Variovorax sp. PCZ-1]MBS7809054.1 helix-turn-helix domain-containing protein [Variovorax sp. PCZ-1]
MPRKSAAPSLSERDAAPGGVAAVDRAMSLLLVFRAGEEPLTLAQLAERSELHKSTVLRLLASLAHAMLVERLPDGRYTLGRGIVRLHRVHQANSTLERIVMPALHELVQTTGESAALHAQWGSGASAQRISLFRVDSPQPIRDHYKVGDILPMNGGTGARVLIAFSADSALASAQKDQNILNLIRKRGYHAAVGDRDLEVAGISAPVFKNESGERVLVGALVLTMPAGRYSENHIPNVVQMAQRLSMSLGAG